MNAPVTPHDLDALLVAHIGRGRGIGAKSIAARLGCTERQVREFITALRMDGRGICGTPETGYYIAATQEEMDETLAFLRARAMHSLVLEARMTRTALQDLIGQLRLPT